jgi:hypothetical protein
MTYRGRVQHGTVILDDPNALADGTEVEIAPVKSDESQPTWAEVFKDVIGKAEGLPSDSSRNHDQHLYGSDQK